MLTHTSFTHTFHTKFIRIDSRPRGSKKVLLKENVHLGRCCLNEKSAKRLTRPCDGAFGGLL